MLTFVIAGMWESKSLILECKTNAGGRDFDKANGVAARFHHIKPQSLYSLIGDFGKSQNKMQMV